MGGLAYAPFRTAPKLDLVTPQLGATFRGAYEGSRRNDPQRLHDLAQLELLADKPRRALRLLERAALITPASAEILSDLAAVYLELNRKDADVADALSALEVSDEAVASNPRLPEARFNRALAFERLYLDDAALDEWRQFFELDSNSSWAKEAEVRVTGLQRRENPSTPALALQELIAASQRGDAATVRALVVNDPQAAREAVEDELLPKWAMQRGGENPTTSRELLEAAESIARAVRIDLKDPFLDDILADVVRWEAVSEQRRRQVAVPVAKSAVSRRDSADSELPLRLGLELLGEGRHNLRNHKIAEAVPLLERAATLLEQARSSALLLARLHLASCAHQQNRTDQAHSLLRKLESDPQLGDYSSLAARVAWMMGLVEARLGNGASSLAAYDRALRLFQGLHDDTGSASIECLLAEELDLVGQPDAAWQHRIRALSVTAGRKGSTAVYNAIDDTVVSLLHSRRPGLALHFQTRLADVAAFLGQSEVRTLTHIRRARILQALDRAAEAEADLAQAEADLVGFDVSTREVIGTEISLVRSELLHPNDPQQAISELTRAIDFHRQGGLAPLLPELLCQRGRLLRAAGNFDAAERDLSIGIAEVERQRRQMHTAGDRIPLFDQAQPLYGTLLSLQLERGQDQLAFATAERSRARVLLDRWQPSASSPHSGDPFSGEPLSGPEVSARLPRGTTLVEFEVVDGQLVTWLCDRERLVRVASTPSFAPLAVEVEALEDALRSGNGLRTAACLRSLHRVLVAPWQTTVAPEETLVFIPTGLLHAVPFAALLDAISGHFLVQDHPSSIAPSASAYVAALARADALEREVPDRALIVGEPRIVRSTPDDEILPDLPAAAAEARTIAAHYPHALLIEGEAATHDGGLDVLPRSGVVHFATHALDVDDPSRARLLLAGGNGERASLTASEISQLDLRQTRLVVLAACSTATGRASASEGPLSLAHAFEVAGVPAVLSSLWPVEDEAAARLFVQFHVLLRSGVGTLSALRTAQLEELARPAPGWTWAALELVGAAPDVATTTDRR